MIVALSWLSPAGARDRARSPASSVPHSPVSSLILSHGSWAVLATFSPNRADLIVVLLLGALGLSRPALAPGRPVDAVAALRHRGRGRPRRAAVLSRGNGARPADALVVDSRRRLGCDRRLPVGARVHLLESRRGAGAPSVAGLFVHLMPVFGVLLAWLFLDERLQLSMSPASP